MNNQPAQTMPELPASRGYLHLHNTGGVSQVYGYTADQMHQYARDYAAMLAAAQAASGGECPTLHPATEDLIRRFSDALRDKLSAAEKKYGYSDGWASPDWMDQCRRHLDQHVAKGDPRDVAAYCAFLWHHGEPTTKRDRDADRKRFPDDDFNAWLDAGISDAGHTVYDALSSIEDAWQGWHGHVLSVRIDENPLFDDLAIDSPSGASVSERARDDRFTAMLIGIIADVQDALGFTDEDKECSNGSLEIVAAIRELKEQALTQQRGCATCGGRGEIGGHVGQTAETFDYVTEPCPECTTPQPSADAVRELVQRWRDRADAHEQNALHACSIGLKESADSMDEKARALRGFADELESLLSGGSHA